MAFCGVGRATAVATSDRAAGQSPSLCPLAGGTVPVPSPAVPTTGRGLCQLPAGAVPRGLGDASMREGGHGTGSADPKRTAGPAWCRAESVVRHWGGS